MPAYNCEKFVKLAIDSVLNQSYGNFELLISDDCSSDTTKEIIDSYKDPRIRTFHNTVNLGYLKASNKLFKQCKGNLISFQDADDYSETDRFQRLVNLLEFDSALDCVGSSVRRISLSGEVVHARAFPETDSEIRSDFEKYKIVFTGSSLLLKKKVIERIGIYNEYFDRIGSEDIYMFSFILQYFKVANICEPLYNYRANPNSVTSTHKDPKAYVNHQLIIHLYKRRLIGKEDYIQSGNWKKADNCAKYLMAINETKTSVIKSIFSFIGISVLAPTLFPQFFREFVSNWRANLN